MWGQDAAQQMTEGCMDREGPALGGGMRLSSDPAVVHRIWPGNGVPPGSEGWDWQERTAQVPWLTINRRYTRNVVVPTLTVHRPARGRASGAAMIVAPGGAFHFLMIDHEGHDMARWLAGMGVTALVLSYRLARTPDDDAVMTEFRTAMHERLKRTRQTDEPSEFRDMLAGVRQMGEEDGRQAIRFARAHAAEWGIDAGRVGIAGFSAGGGVTMGAAMEYDTASRPDFAVGVYPSRRAELSVPKDAPPLFLVHSDDDPLVPALSTVRLYEAWHAAGAAAELHLFGNGGHGYGMAKEGWLSDAWPGLLERWMRERGLV
jgi:acetyl esterase/lipase